MLLSRSVIIGVFNLDRIGIGVLYYGSGIPYILKSAPPFAGFLRCSRDRGATAYAASHQPSNRPPWRRRSLSPLVAAGSPPRSLAILQLVLIGHASAVVLVLAFPLLPLRYRFDFAPFMTLAAFVGYRSLSMTVAGFSGIWRRPTLVAAVGLCVLGVLGSHYILLIHKVWSIGVPMEVRHALFPFAPFAHAAFEP